MSKPISEDDAALVAHKIVLAVFVSEAESRLGDEAGDLLSQIRRAAVASIERAQGTSSAGDLRSTKRLIIEAIDDIFSGS